VELQEKSFRIYSPIKVYCMCSHVVRDRSKIWPLGGEQAFMSYYIMTKLFSFSPLQGFPNGLKDITFVDVVYGFRF